MGGNRHGDAETLPETIPGNTLPPMAEGLEHPLGWQSVSVRHAKPRDLPETGIANPALFTAVFPGVGRDVAVYFLRKAKSPQRQPAGQQQPGEDWWVGHFSPIASAACDRVQAAPV